MSEHSQDVLISTHERVATITINREARRNALSGGVITGLLDAIKRCDQDPEVGVLVITGAGDRVFCAGGDLGDQRMSEGALGMHHDRGEFVELLMAIQHCSKPIVGRINGHALGGGFGLTLSCDVAIAADTATFGMPEIKVGLFPMMIMAVVVRNIGRKRAMEMMLTGERISADVALEQGVVNKVVPADRLDEATHEMAKKIAGFSPAVLRLGRQAFYATQDMSFEQALRYLQSQLSLNTLAEDAAEGIMAFMERREPEWKGR